MKLSLKFKDGFWSNELNKSFSAGLYQAKEIKEYNALAKHAGVEPIIEEKKGKKDKNSQATNGNSSEVEAQKPDENNEGNQ